jgi:hypothetical protein
MAEVSDDATFQEHLKPPYFRCEYGDLMYGAGIGALLFLLAALIVREMLQVSVLK